MISDAAPTLAEAAPLLAAAGLPTDDLAEAAGLRLFGIRHEQRLVGVVGVQPLDGAALLRSLAVAPGERGGGKGAGLVATAEAYARSSGWNELYLLTTDAAGYFRRLGYETMSRDQAPAAVRGTRQFAALCPASAQLMHKRLAVPD